MDISSVIAPGYLGLQRSAAPNSGLQYRLNRQASVKVADLLKIAYRLRALGDDLITAATSRTWRLKSNETKMDLSSYFLQ